jgi:hypothetical protein
VASNGVVDICARVCHCCSEISRIFDAGKFVGSQSSGVIGIAFFDEFSGFGSGSSHNARRRRVFKEFVNMPNRGRSRRRIRR